MSLKYLSYPFTAVMPVYGNPQEKLQWEKLKCPTRGDSCSTYRMTFENHWGTHVDAPAHFFEGSRTVADYPADFWLFKKPQLIKVELKAGELLRVSHLKKISKQTDLLLFRSGWFKKREHADYALRNPGVHAEVGVHLREQYPNVRAIGFDWISLSSRLDRKMGREAHRVFLNPTKPGKPVLIIEDMDLSAASFALKQVQVAPWLIRGLDSAPCTVIGTVK